MGWYVAPAGTVTVSCVAVAAVTVALVPPKKTMLLAGVGLKFVPVMVTVVPMGPEVGVKKLIVGTDAGGEHTAPDGISPKIVHPLVAVKLVLAAKAFVPYCLPVATRILLFGVDGLAFHPNRVAV